MLTEQLVKRFVPDPENINNTNVRQRYGRLAGIVGIVCNTALCIAKLFAGLFSNSISITADAINNLSDAGSSIITLIGFHIAGKPADKDHPFGHARVEYISGLIVSFLILLVGFDIGKSSFQKILHPEKTEFSVLILIILAVSILLKLWMALFNRTLSQKISSTALDATAADSRNDAIATSAVLAATLLSHFTPLMLDGYMGLAVAIFIFVSGLQLVRDTLNPLLGEAPQHDMLVVIQRKILSYEGIIGTHDLVVHSYGPGQYFASVHAEMDAKGDMLTCHDIIDSIEREFLQDGIHMVIHLDPLVTDDEITNELHRHTLEIVKDVNERLSIHDFRVVTGAQHRNLLFDVVKPMEIEMCNQELELELCKRISQWDPTLHAVITIDNCYTSFSSE